MCQLHLTGRKNIRFHKKKSTFVHGSCVNVINLASQFTSYHCPHKLQKTFYGYLTAYAIQEITKSLWEAG